MTRLMAFQALEFLQGKMGSESQATALHPNIGQEIGRVKRPLSALSGVSACQNCCDWHTLPGIIGYGVQTRTFIGFTQLLI
jgi:hypothetical protein